jgi:lipoate-protein ligase A
MHFFFADYAFNRQKFGGNAQSITKNRWVHHTSFLWDYDLKNMDYLKNPQRAPEYRQVRSSLHNILP